MAGRAKKQHLEEDECAALVQWARLSRFVTTEDELLAGVIGDYLLRNNNDTHIAGTPRARAMKMARMKKTGFRTGVADYYLAIPASGYAGMWIEMKRKLSDYRNMGEAERAVSAVQEEFLDQMTEAGYASVVAYGWEAAREAITEYLDGSIVEGSEVIVKPLLH